MPPTDDPFDDLVLEDVSAMPILNDEQFARLVALTQVKPLITPTSLGGKSAPDVYDLITLATWVIYGDKEEKDA